MPPGHGQQGWSFQRGRSYWVALVIISVASCFAFVLGARQGDSPWKPEIPKTWDDAALASMQVPLANPKASPTFAPASYYYRIPVRTIYTGYPVYRPDKEPPGYMEWLRKQEPAIAFDVTKLHSKADWIKAGQTVFNAPIDFDIQMFMNLSDVRDMKWYEKLHVPITKDGVMPFASYVIRQRGKVELGVGSCATCHLRVMPDGTTIPGAQGNMPYDRVAAYALRARASESMDEKAFVAAAEHERRLALGVPWLQPDPVSGLDRMSLDDLAHLQEAIPPGDALRVNTSYDYPPQIPDLIGVQHRRFFNHTGSLRQRSIGDLMRYAALVQGGVRFERFLNFAVLPQLPDPSTQLRYSDAQLYALALYIYSLRPPRNPNKFTSMAARGKQIFEREGCASCHTPPLYTNNKLTIAQGFHPAALDMKRFGIHPFSIGTDPGLALRTREGTGYYKVPSLKGVWYRGPFGHDGSVATLEDWFDPRRTRDDYMPTAFHRWGAKSEPVKGHPFGLDLTSEDRKALIAYLKTL
jgi:hypothetical protein